jgi:hypothetical protein
MLQNAKSTIILRNGYIWQSRSGFKGTKEVDSKENNGRSWKRLRFKEK